MTKLLVRIFIKNSDDLENPDVRGKYGTLAGIVGIICNVILFIAKLLIGTLSGSVSITADAVNNLSDASSSVLTLIGFHISKRPADDEHPFGHARFEYLSGLAVAALIVVIGYQLAKSSIDKIVHPTEVEFSAALVIVLVLSILIKLWMAVFNKTLGKKINSTSLIATAADSRNDVISTGAVLIAAVVAQLSGYILDGYIGLLVAVFILYSGFSIAKETINPLLGEPADEELVQMISDVIMGFDSHILGIHDLMVHDYGPGQCFASVHVEIDSNESVMEMHEIIDDIERLMFDKHRIQLVIHYDPIVTDDEETNKMHHMVSEKLKSIDNRLHMHDFRMVVGPNHTNLIFDVVVPYNLKGKEREIQDSLNESVNLGQEERKYYTVITFDSSSFNTFHSADVSEE